MANKANPANVATIADIDVPLCVDLDGTLVKSDTLYDSLCILLRQRPLALLQVPFLWWSRGKAAVKAMLASLSPLDAAHLPYNQAVLRFLHEQHDLGRPIYLATGADASLAHRVADHLGLFAGVIASDGATNFVGGRKLRGLSERFPVFDYIGNATPDLPALAAAREAYIANPTRGLKIGLQGRKIRVADRFQDRRPTFAALIRAIRVHQWAKNILLFFPLLLSHEVNLRTMISAVAAFFCFSFIASANYIVNDLLDIDSDRRHAKKRFRPFAAGDLAVFGGVEVAITLIVATCLILPRLPLQFALWLLLYAVATSTYSLWLKRIPLVDVLVLSGLYALRMLAGAAATRTLFSPWLSALAIFLFLSLAMVKRFSELANVRERGSGNPHGRGYRVDDIEQIRSFGTASAYASVVVFALYISRPDVSVLYRHSGRLWLIVPFMLYWLNRVWLLASRGELDEDPVVFAIRDKVSLAVGLCIAALAVFATL